MTHSWVAGGEEMEHMGEIRLDGGIRYSTWKIDLTTSYLVKLSLGSEGIDDGLIEADSSSEGGWCKIK